MIQYSTQFSGYPIGLAVAATLRCCAVRYAARQLRLALLLLSCLTLILFTAGAAAFDLKSVTGNQGMGEFLPVDEALPFSSSLTDQGVQIVWNIAPEHYLYRDRIAVTATEPGVTVGEPSFSLPGHLKDDPYFGEVTVFTEPVQATVPVELPEGMTEANLQVRYQGCAEAGLCYPPQTQDVLYVASAGAAPGTPSGPGPSPAAAVNPALDTASASGIASVLANQSTLVIVGLFLLLGLGLTFTPCVLPMIPIISALVSNRTTSSTRQAVMLAFSYVMGMALTYAAAGVLTGLLGASFNLQAQLQAPAVLLVFATLFALFALSMFGLFDIRLPQGITHRLNQASSQLTGGRVASVFGIGALSALIVSPCVSAPLAGSLLYISTTQDAVLGGVALLALGIGMGMPLILVAVGGRRFLPTAGPWMNTVKAIYGVMMMAVAIWLLERLVPGWISLLLWGVLAAVTGVQLGAFESASAGWQRTWKGFGLVLFSYAILLLGGALAGAQDPLRPLSPFTAQTRMTADSGEAAIEESVFRRISSPATLKQALATAARANQPVMLDFYADWCISCKVMERNVFSDSRVRSAMAPLTLLQIDVTENSPDQQALLDELGLFGPPAILFFDADGEEIARSRVMGEMDRTEFLAHLKQTLSRSSIL
ncbi:protein-disulfide reductase DsbD [Marinobacter fonticola]|uniref:protein-disulfide reductase DsbD n=1 Tax=Marinobacter fonticola TaxID=2603215 RepID=UPI0011E8995A|nr:protein-disulfide reductase DsbD [Marinobacter fonticola]